VRFISFGCYDVHLTERVQSSHRTLRVLLISTLSPTEVIFFFAPIKTDSIRSKLSGLDEHLALIYTSIPWAVRLSWLKIPVHAPFVRRAILTGNVGQCFWWGDHGLLIGLCTQNYNILRVQRLRLVTGVRSKLQNHHNTSHSLQSTMILVPMITKWHGQYVFD